MLRQRSRTLALIALSGLLLAAAPAWAQTNDEVNAGVQFNFTPPGARSLSLGGAFLATADDASSAVTNPAGLIGLTRVEFSIEGLYDRITHRFSNAGNGSGTASGMGVDTIPGVVQGEATEGIFGVSFMSAVYPGSRWSAALYRHELADFRTSYTRQGPFFNSTVANGALRRVFPAIAAMDLSITNFGVAGAYSVTDNFWLGAAMYVGDFGISSSIERYNPRQGASGVEGRTNLVSPPNFSPENLANAQFQSGVDRGVGGTVGAVWIINDQWRVGAVARPGPSYEYVARSVIGPNDPQGIPGTVKTLPAEFKVPDQYGIGLSYQPTTTWRVNFDYDRIQYSQMTDNLTKILDDRSDDVTAEDANELHVGVEYTVLRRNPIALRAGAWYEPDHRFVYRGDPVLDVELRELNVFRPGDDQWHVSGGFGIILSDRYLVDAAIDYSEFRTQATVYFTIQFGSPGSTSTGTGEAEAAELPLRKRNPSVARD